MAPEEGSTVVVVWNVVVHVVDVVDLVFLEIVASESESDGSPLVICNCMIFIITFILDASDTGHLCNATRSESRVRTVEKVQLVPLAPGNVIIMQSWFGTKSIL